MRRSLATPGAGPALGLSGPRPGRGPGGRPHRSRGSLVTELAGGERPGLTEQAQHGGQGIIAGGWIVPVTIQCRLEAGSGSWPTPACAATCREEQAAEVYGDCAYGTGGLRAALAGSGHTAVIKPKPLTSAVEGGFTLDDFTAGEQAGTVICPNGIIRRITARRSVTFGAACRNCPLRVRCITNKTGRALILHKHDGLLRAARRDRAASPALHENYRTCRPNIERAIAQAATWRGRRLKLRYRGTTRNNAWLKRLTAALNLRNLIRWGLARRDGTWAGSRT